MKLLKNIFLNKYKNYGKFEIFSHWGLLLLPIGILVCFQVGDGQWQNVNSLIGQSNNSVVINVVFLAIFLTLFIICLVFKFAVLIRNWKNPKKKKSDKESDFWY